MIRYHLSHVALSIEHLLGVSLFILLFSAMACENKQNRIKEETPTLKAYRLIDEQRTDEAIEVLEVELQKEPHQIEYTSALASAYAHKAGIKIQKLIPVVTQADRVNKLKDKFIEISDKHSASEKINDSAVNTSIFLIKLSTMIDAYAAVPVLTKEEAVYLKHAIGLLNKIGKNITADDVLYRAVLEIILFKHIFAENLIGDFITPARPGNAKCRVEIGRLNDTLITLGKLLIDIFNDLGYIRPKQADSMKRLSLATSEAISNLTLTTTAIAVLDETSNILLKQALLQQGLGKIIRCD